MCVFVFPSATVCVCVCSCSLLQLVVVVQSRLQIDCSSQTCSPVAFEQLMKMVSFDDIVHGAGQSRIQACDGG